MEKFHKFILINAVSFFRNTSGIEACRYHSLVVENINGDLVSAKMDKRRYKYGSSAYKVSDLWNPIFTPSHFNSIWQKAD